MKIIRFIPCLLLLQFLICGAARAQDTKKLLKNFVTEISHAQMRSTDSNGVSGPTISTMDTTYIHVKHARYAANTSRFELNNTLTGILSQISFFEGYVAIFLVSNFYEHKDKAIMHREIEVTIGDTTRLLQEGMVDQEFWGKKVIETTQFPADNGILKWIAENYTRDIQVKFLGADKSFSAELTKENKLGLKETYDLYVYLRQQRGQPLE